MENLWGVPFLITENHSKNVYDVEHFLNSDQKKELLSHSKTFDISKLRKQFREESYNRLSFLSKSRFEITSQTIVFEQEKDYRIAEQVRSLNESPIVCAQYGTTVKCSCGTLLSSPTLCREKKVCPTCNKIYSHSMMKNIYRVLTSIPDSYWAENVLTYPQYYFDETELSKEDIFKIMFKHANTWIKKLYGKKTGVVMVCHSWHSKNPLSPDSHFHVHILIPDFVFYPQVEKSLVPCRTIDLRGKANKTFDRKSRTIISYSKMKRIRFHQSHEGLKEFRRTWANIINYHETDVNIYHEYFNSKRKLQHKITYIVRGAVRDFNNFFLEEKNQHIEMTTKHKERFDYHTSFQVAFNRVRWYGYLCNSQRGKFLNYLIPLEIRKLLDEVYKSFEVCPICFERFDAVQAQTKLYDSETMVRTLRMDIITYENYHHFTGTNEKEVEDYV